LAGRFRRSERRDERARDDVTLRNLPLVVSNVGHVARNRTAKLQRRARQMVLRGMKSVRKTAKRVRASMWAAVTSGRDAGRHGIGGQDRARVGRDQR